MCSTILLNQDTSCTKPAYTGLKHHWSPCSPELSLTIPVPSNALEYCSECASFTYLKYIVSEYGHFVFTQNDPVLHLYNLYCCICLVNLSNLLLLYNRSVQPGGFNPCPLSFPQAVYAFFCLFQPKILPQKWMGKLAFHSSCGSLPWQDSVV